MNKLTHSLPAKITAIILLIIIFTVTIASALGIIFLADNEMYSKPNMTFYDTNFCSSVVHEKIDRIIYLYAINTGKIHAQGDYTQNRIKKNLNGLSNNYTTNRTNMFFVLKDEDNNILFSNYIEQDYAFKKEYSSSQYTDDMIIATCYVRADLSVKDDFYIAKYWFDITYPARYNLIIVSVVGAIVSLVLFIFLLCSAGHRKGKEEVTLNGIDKIPFDLYIAAIIAGIAGCIAIIDDFRASTIYIIIYATPFIIIGLLLLLSLFMTFATRYKKGGGWRNTVIYRCLKLMRKLLKSVHRGIKNIFNNLPILWKAVSIFAGITILEFILIILMYDKSGFALLLLLEKGILGALICFAAIHLRRLKDGAEKISHGNFGYKINTDKMFWDFKEHAENLNNINNGISKAVDERIKSERFKTELITNVSHDIKTPLTSIINYVDLLKKENIESETAQEYIEVLDRQSKRLKKLTEDIVEASKASTGNITVSPAKVNVKELLTQAIGEYNERLESCSIEPIVNLPEENSYVFADGRLLWRVFDNLLSNICKYSLPNSRAYFTVEASNEKIEICFKNISKYALNISNEELTNRFVRGDSSRSTEGSGLGLSIAKSLTELLKGSFDIFIDGDLFKVIILFDEMQ